VEGRGQQLSDCALVYQDDDERFNLGVGRTRDGEFLVMESASHTTTECHVLPAGEPGGEFTLISPREDEHEYTVDHRDGLWLIRSNDRGRNFRLVSAPEATPGREHWTELIPHRNQVMLEDIELFSSFFVACERQDGLPRLRLWRFAGDGAEAARAGEIKFLNRLTARIPREPRFRRDDLPLCLRVAGDARFGFRVRRGYALVDAAEAA